MQAYGLSTSYMSRGLANAGDKLPPQRGDLFLQSGVVARKVARSWAVVGRSASFFRWTAPSEREPERRASRKYTGRRRPGRIGAVGVPADLRFGTHYAPQLDLV